MQASLLDFIKPLGLDEARRVLSIVEDRGYAVVAGRGFATLIDGEEANVPYELLEEQLLKLIRDLGGELRVKERFSDHDVTLENERFIIRINRKRTLNPWLYVKRR